MVSQAAAQPAGVLNEGYKIMRQSSLTRRGVLAAGAGIALTGTAMTGTAAAQQVPWSTGTEPAKTRAPAHATDCHHHIYDSRFPIDPTATLKPGDATVADYRLLQKRIGTTRHVVVQPSTYGVDNRCLLDALAQFGIRTARGVAVVNTSVTDAELDTLHKAGVRGIRFNLAQAGATTVEMIEPLSQRVVKRGWHIQVNAPSETIRANATIWDRVPTQVVFDHLAHLHEPDGVKDPALAVVSALLAKNKAWVKLSGAYTDTKVGPPTYADATVVAQAYVRLAPHRLVWGSDWPHPTEKADAKPDDALLFDLLSQWAPDEHTRRLILVDNPARLYGFN
jgi:predicted TIM-barrel fold metal-dependent hydrolase